MASGLRGTAGTLSIGDDTASVLASAHGLRLETIADNPLIADWRAAIAACGLKPSTYKSSPEQLARRVLKSGPLRTPLPLVDLYCDVATRHLAPMGAYDLSRLPEAAVVLRLTRPESDVFHPLGARDGEMPLTPRVAVYAAGDTVICWAYNCRDSRDTCLQEDTDAGLFIGEAVTARQHDALRGALDELAMRLAVAGASVGPVGFAGASAGSPTVAVSL